MSFYDNGLNDNTEMFMPHVSTLPIRQQIFFAVDAALKILRSHPDVVKYGNSDGYVYIPAFKKIFEKVTGVTLTPELLEAIKSDRNIMIHATSNNYIRAIYGHHGAVLAYMMAKTHTLYTGPRQIFAFTHFLMDGLGALNSGRTVNMLIAPEFLANKGVKAYVNLQTLTENGIQLWKQNGDMHTARVYCYSPDLLNFAYNFDFTADFFKVDNLFKMHSKLIDVYKVLYAHLDKESFEKKAKKKLIKLILVDEDLVDEEMEDEEDIEEEDKSNSVIDLTELLQSQKL
jgi:hypothetical protein